MVHYNVIQIKTLPGSYVEEGEMLRFAQHLVSAERERCAAIVDEARTEERRSRGYGEHDIDPWSLVLLAAAKKIRSGVTTAERDRILQVVRSAGCLCYELYVANEERGTRFTGEWSIREDRAIYHDHRCPVALATSVEAQRKE